MKTQFQLMNKDSYTDIQLLTLTKPSQNCFDSSGKHKTIVKKGETILQIMLKLTAAGGMCIVLT